MRVLEHEEERQQHRHRQQHRPAAAHRIDVMFLVEPEHLLLLLLRVILVAFLRRLHQRLHRLELHVGAHGLLVERPEQHAHHDAEENERHAVGEPQPLVHGHEEPAHRHRKEADHGAEAGPAVRIHVVELVPDRRQARILHRPGVERVLEISGRRHREAGAHSATAGRLRRVGRRQRRDATDPPRGRRRVEGNRLATKYLDLTATHSNGPLTTVGTPALSPEKSWRCASVSLVTKAKAWRFCVESASALCSPSPTPRAGARRWGRAR